ncbi:MAG: hypothetical protein IBX72_09865 [Nitrospirae bacterium]|jgi:hypothetical protein|nr:hypothetical protein [Nitrospirota bacterium]
MNATREKIKVKKNQNKEDNRRRAKVDKCPKQKKDCQNCEILDCPEETT